MMDENDIRLMQQLLQAQTAYGKTQRTVDDYSDIIDSLDFLRNLKGVPEKVHELAGVAQVAMMKLHIAVIEWIKEEG